MADRLVMTRLVKGKAPGREFDIEFWQKLGPEAIFAAAWDLVVTAAAVRGIDESQLRLQRSVTKRERGRQRTRRLRLTGPMRQDRERSGNETRAVLGEQVALR